MYPSQLCMVHEHLQASTVSWNDFSQDERAFQSPAFVKNPKCVKILICSRKDTARCQRQRKSDRVQCCKFFANANQVIKFLLVIRFNVFLCICNYLTVFIASTLAVRLNI